MAWTNVLKSSCLDVAGVVDLPLSLLSEAFQRNLSVRHIAQLVTHGKTGNCKVCLTNPVITLGPMGHGPSDWKV